jgi:hypothetical protein
MEVTNEELRFAAEQFYRADNMVTDLAAKFPAMAAIFKVFMISRFEQTFAQRFFDHIKSQPQFDYTDIVKFAKIIRIRFGCTLQTINNVIRPNAVRVNRVGGIRIARFDITPRIISTPNAANVRALFSPIARRIVPRDTIEPRTLMHADEAAAAEQQLMLERRAQREEDEEIRAEEEQALINAHQADEAALHFAMETSELLLGTQYAGQDEDAQQEWVPPPEDPRIARMERQREQEGGDAQRQADGWAVWKGYEH